MSFLSMCYVFYEGTNATLVVDKDGYDNIVQKVNESIANEKAPKKKVVAACKAELDSIIDMYKKTGIMTQPNNIKFWFDVLTLLHHGAIKNDDMNGTLCMTSSCRCETCGAAKCPVRCDSCPFVFYCSNKCRNKNAEKHKANCTTNIDLRNPIGEEKKAEHDWDARLAAHNANPGCVYTKFFSRAPRGFVKEMARKLGADATIEKLESMGFRFDPLWTELSAKEALDLIKADMS